jgi:hypothetical protein
MDDYFEYLWKIINSPEKFEIASYLIVSIEDNNSKWYLTPKTRDGKKDGVGFFKSGKNYFEAKYLTKDEKKLLLDKVSGSIINAFYNKVSKLWIFTNREIGLELINFVSKHNDIQKLILQHSTEVILFDGKQTAISLLKHPISKFAIKNLELDFIGYKSTPNFRIAKYREQNIKTNEGIIFDIQKLKKTYTENFFHFPIVQGLYKIDDLLRHKVLESYFKLSFFFLLGEEFVEEINVAIGEKFAICIKIDNYFYEEIRYDIYIKTNSRVDILGEWALSKDGLFKTSGFIEAINSNIKIVECKCEEYPLNEIEFQFDIFAKSTQDCFSMYKKISKEICVSNKLFFSPYIFGEKHECILNNSKSIIDKCYLQSEYNISLITGRAGSGKTRFIEELILHAQRNRGKIEVFKYSLISDSFYAIIQKTLSFFLFIDINSYTNITTEVLKAYSNNIDFNACFKDDNEFEKFYTQLESLLTNAVGNIDNIFISQITEFLGKLILKLSKTRMIMLVIEDLHHGDKYFFKFILEFNKLFRSRKQCPIIILLAARTELKEFSIHFEQFQKEIELIQSNNIEHVYVDDLEENDAMALIRELVGLSCSKNRKIIQRVVKISGNNPFNIIHTLLQLKNDGIILQDFKNDYYWANLARLNKIDTHLNINKLFYERFVFYRKNEHANTIIKIIQILVIFKSKVPYLFCENLFQVNDAFVNMLNLLVEERIINTSKGYIEFEHENIYKYAINNLMFEVEEIAERVYNHIELLKSYNYKEEIIIRALFWCQSKYEIDFFEKAFSFFNRLLSVDAWRDCVYYGNLFIEKGNNNLICEPYYLFYVKFRVLMIESEYSGVTPALNGLDKLESDLHEYLSIQTNKDSTSIREKYYMLFYEVRLNKGDILILAERLTETELCLDSLEKEIIEYQEKSHNESSYSLLNSYLAWLYNRRGVMYKKLFLIEKGQQEITKGLKVARKIHHEYYIHHCFYDLCIGYMLLGKYKKALNYCQNSMSDVLELPSYRNAKVRTLIQLGFIYKVLNKSLDAITYLSEAIDIAMRYDFYYELNRALLYLANVYLLDKRYDEAHEILMEAIAYTHVNQGIGLKLGIYCDYAFSCVNRFYKYDNIYDLQEGITYYKKLFSIVMGNNKNPQIQLPYDFWNTLVIYNMKQLSNMLLNINKEITDIKSIIIKENYKELSIINEYVIPIKLPENRNAYLLREHYDYYAIFN